MDSKGNRGGPNQFLLGIFALAMKLGKMKKEALDKALRQAGEREAEKVFLERPHVILKSATPFPFSRYSLHATNRVHRTVKGRFKKDGELFSTIQMAPVFEARLRPSRYSGAALRRLRAKRGVGRPPAKLKGA